jgi:gluconolactonase
MPAEQEPVWRPNERYPDAAVQVLDPRFNKYRLVLASVERLATGCRWSEGPVYFGDMGCVLWSDIPNNRLMRWDEETGAVSVFRKPSNNANGNTRDRQGRLITCEHDTRRVTRTEYDGTITVICDSYQGKRLNSPNDVVVKSDGSIWFTDPRFGILSFYEGHVDTSELPMSVYRVDGQTGAVSLIADDINAPNGLAFSPDEKKIYIVESRSQPRRILVYDVVGDGTKIANGKILIDSGPDGTPDGFRVDIDGNLWCGWGMTPQLDGVRVFAPDGAPIGHISLPERCANVCFGGRYRNRLFMAASHSLYSLYVNTQGVQGG